MHPIRRIGIAIIMMGMLCLSACTNTEHHQTKKTEKEQPMKTVLEMDMDADYSDAEPFQNGLLFCVTKDTKTLDAEVSMQMDGNKGMVEIKERHGNDILWKKTWTGNVKQNTAIITLKNLYKDKEYIVQFTGTKIQQAVVKVSFASDLVYEKARPSK